MPFETGPNIVDTAGKLDRQLAQLTEVLSAAAAVLQSCPASHTCTTPGPCCATLTGLRRVLRGCVATASVSTACRGPAAASCGLAAGAQSSAHTGPPANSTLSTAKVASVGSCCCCCRWWWSSLSVSCAAAGGSTGDLMRSTAREVNSCMRWLCADRGRRMAIDSGCAVEGNNVRAWSRGEVLVGAG